MADTPQSSPKCLLINPQTMGSLTLKPEQINLIILALIGFSHETTGADQVLASDLADTIHKHVFERPLLQQAEQAPVKKVFSPSITQRERQFNDIDGIRRR